MYSFAQKAIQFERLNRRMSPKDLCCCSLEVQKFGEKILRRQNTILPHTTYKKVWLGPSNLIVSK